MSITNNTLKSFQTNRKFYDDANYPRGLNRSGDFSIKEVALLEDYGIAFLELSSGKRAPETDAEVQFLEVCQGKVLPNTAEEKVWIKYHNKILTPKQFHTLFGRHKVQITEDTESDDIDEE